MRIFISIKQWGNQWLENLRLRLSHADALPQLALMGVLSGLLAGVVIIAFRLLIESVQVSFLPQGESENFEGLSLLWHFLLPLLGGLIIGLVFQWAAKESTHVGIVHVMERLAYHQGHLPFKNMVLQFFGAAASIISGHSVGREGPSVHLGAASSSLLGKYLGLPNNSIRTLVACGTAAAIAASFNTPLAGVIFAMEVVLMEYTLSGFMPVILASVSATTITRLVFGSEPAFQIPAMELGSLMELPFIVLMGLLIGAMAAAFIHLLQIFSGTLSNQAIWIRMTTAGFIVGICAVLVPAVMGVGYDTVNSTLLGQTGMLALFMIVVFKMLATTAGLGLGIPGGLIGPTLVIGAAMGGLMGQLGATIFTEGVFSPAFYALLGMVAMMGATLQAPLAALIAMLELTANENIILPGMLAVITACLASRQLFGKQSVYLILIQAKGLDYRHDPVSQSLRRTGVAGAMNRDFITLPDVVSVEIAKTSIEKKPRWIVINKDQTRILMPAADLARKLQEHEAEEQKSLEDINLLEIPAQRMELESIHLQANLQEALEKMQESHAEALCVTRTTAPGINPIYGILTKQDIDSSYH